MDLKPAETVLLKVIALVWLKCLGSISCESSIFSKTNLANIYLSKVNNKDTRKKCEICSKLTLKTPERRQWHRFGASTVRFEHISYVFPVFLLLTLNK